MPGSAAPFEGFFGELLAENAPLHSATLAHPFVIGIGNGSLEPSAFRFYLEQDFQFLERYLRVIALAVAAAPDMASMTHLAELLHATLAVEIDALRGLYASFDGEPAMLGTTRPAPTCRAYTDHLLRVAQQQDLLATLAAMLPCQWGYGDIGKALQGRGLPSDMRFAGWISEYASAEYHASVGWAIKCFNELAEDSGIGQRAVARDAFRVSARYEYDFWQMAWTGQATAVEVIN
jgi:thiaminase/transcriptional activator TenA